jgi:tetratricopeptide (TPR) repeat protein
MGTVWMAEQTEPIRRRVAVKVVKEGMDSKQVLARFEAERQALALMDHPNIATVLDAGRAPSGRPYFVMELVKGQPITKYCDEKRQDVHERLALFGDVCRAVQHAHQKGIIHRDIKPSNVLVALYDGRPVVKVIDFGVAKATGRRLTDRTLFTGFGAIVGTPEYMSPEQAEVSNQDIDTRSDIFSLGVLLYELLTGSTPLTRQRVKDAALLEVLRVIREEEPPRPSTRLSESKDSLPSISAQRQTEPAKLTKLVRGELDWIVMKALEKDRNRRYETANGFATDVQRYLADEQVLACPPSASYRLRKFARRHKTRLAAATVFGLAMLVAIGGIGWAVRDRAARAAEAEQNRFDRQQRATTALGLMLDEVDRLEWEQKWAQALAAADRAEAAALAGGDADDATRERVREVRRTLAFIARLDRIRQNRAAALVATEKELHNRAALRDYALAFREHGAGIDALSADAAVRRLQSRPALAVPIAAALDDWKEACLMLGESEPSWKRLVAVARGLDPDPLRDRLRAAWGQTVTPELLAELRRLAESMNGGNHSPATVQALASTLGRAGLPDLATKVLQTGVTAHPADSWLYQTLARDCAERKNLADAIRYAAVVVSLRPDSAAAHNVLGAYLLNQGNLDEAITRLRRTLDLDDHYAPAHNNLAIALVQMGKPDEAIGHCKKAIALQSDYAQAHATLGFALIKQGKTDEAIGAFRRSIDLNPNDGFAQHSLGVLLCNHKHDYPGAIAAFHRAIALEPEEATHYHALGCVHNDSKNWDGAIAALQKTLTLTSRERNWKPTLTHLKLGALLCDVKHDYDGAIVEFKKAIALDPNRAAAHYNLGNALQAKGAADDAIAAYRQAIHLDKDHAEAHCNLGLRLVQKGQLREGLDEVRRGHEIGSRGAGWPYPSADWVRHCERLVALEEKLPGILENKTTPTGSAELIQLASICAPQQLHRAAARFYAEAFVAEPRLLNNLAAPYRYNAACSAALAGCGRGKDATKLESKEYARLRRQALDWLRADLEAWGRLFDKEPDKIRPVLVQKLRQWLADTDFAGVRGPQAFALLPEAERQPWQKFWDDVASLLARAQAKPGAN